MRIMKGKLHSTRLSTAVHTRKNEKTTPKQERKEEDANELFRIFIDALFYNNVDNNMKSMI